MNSIDNIPLVDANTVAKALGIEPSTVYVMRRRGEIQGVKVGKKTLRFSLPEILENLKSRSASVK
jgi:excisionase family DNA binding protein